MTLVTFVCSDCRVEITEDARNLLPGVCLACRYFRWRRGEIGIEVLRHPRLDDPSAKLS